MQGQGKSSIALLFQVRLQKFWPLASFLGFGSTALLVSETLRQLFFDEAQIAMISDVSPQYLHPAILAPAFVMMHEPCQEKASPKVLWPDKMPTSMLGQPWDA